MSTSTSSVMRSHEPLLVGAPVEVNSFGASGGGVCRTLTPTRNAIGLKPADGVLSLLSRTAALSPWRSIPGSGSGAGSPPSRGRGRESHCPPGHRQEQTRPKSWLVLPLHPPRHVRMPYFVFEETSWLVMMEPGGQMLAE